MRILLRKKDCREFYVKPGIWSADMLVASAFDSVRDALLTICAEGLQADLHHSFGARGEFDFTLSCPTLPGLPPG